MILLLDNYDSFTYNIYQMVGETHPDILVIRNDKLTLDMVNYLNPAQIIFSPGPGYPSTAGIMPSVIRTFCRDIPMLGICLGHQALAESFGARIVEAPVPVHGKSSGIRITEESPIFSGLPRQTMAGRYHSLTVERQSLPDCFEIIAESEEDRLIMGIQHKELPLFGLQFHPESILTEHGARMMENFLTHTGVYASSSII